MAKKIDKVDRLETEKVPSLLLKMAIPASISLIFSSLYNIIDTMFVSYLGEYALAGISLVNPITLILSAIGIGVGVGISSCISRLLGQNKSSKVSTYIFSGLTCGIVFWLMFIIVGLFFSTHYISQFSDNQEVVKYGVDYMTIICCGCVGNLLCQIGYSTLQGSGEMTKPMIAQIIGLSINTIFDPFIIFGIGPFPKMELCGAAISTVISEAISMIIILAMIFSNKNPKTKISIKQYHVELDAIKNILKIGIPASLVTIVSSIATTFINKILIMYSPSAIAVYGIFMKINNFLTMPIFAIIRASGSILGHAYGRKNIKRFKQAVLWSCIYGAIIYGIGALIVNLFTVQLLSIFNTNDQMLEIGINCMRILSTTFVIAGISIPLSNCFNPAGKSMLSLSSSLFRQLIVIVPSCYLLGQIGGIDMLWWAFPLADIMNFIFIIIVYSIFIKKTEKALNT